MNKTQIKKLVGNKFFTVTFTKANGELRTMNARLGVTKHLQGGTKKYDKQNLLTVFDVTKKGYRTVNIDAIQELRANGQVLRF